MKKKDRYKVQNQTQVDKQLLKQKQDQALSNTNMAVLFSTLETIYMSKNSNPQYKAFFQYYDYCDYKMTKREEEIIEQMEMQITLFEGSYNLFTKKFGEYGFPENLSKEIVLDFLNKWRKVPELKENCENLMQMFCGNAKCILLDEDEDKEEEEENKETLGKEENENINSSFNSDNQSIEDEKWDEKINQPKTLPKNESRQKEKYGSYNIAWVIWSTIVSYFTYLLLWFFNSKMDPPKKWQDKKCNQHEKKKDRFNTFKGANFNLGVLYNVIPNIANNTHDIAGKVKKDMEEGGTGNTNLVWGQGNDINSVRAAMKRAEQINGGTEEEIKKNIEKTNKQYNSSFW